MARSPRGTDPAVRYASIRLDDDQLQRLADLVAARLGRTASTPSPLVDAKELARLLSVSRSVVYHHARDLGAIRIGAGERGRLRFDPAVAMRAAYTRSPPSRPRPFRRNPVDRGSLNTGPREASLPRAYGRMGRRDWSLERCQGLPDA